jgi:hypothetical protein
MVSHDHHRSLMHVSIHQLDTAPRMSNTQLSYKPHVSLASSSDDPTTTTARVMVVINMASFYATLYY